MNKLATAFKFGTIALLLAAIVQCSSSVEQGSSKSQIHDVKDALQDAEGKIHGVKDASQDAEGKIHDIIDLTKKLAKHLSKNLV